MSMPPPARVVAGSELLCRSILVRMVAQRENRTREVIEQRSRLLVPVVVAVCDISDGDDLRPLCTAG